MSASSIRRILRPLVRDFPDSTVRQLYYQAVARGLYPLTQKAYLRFKAAHGGSN